MLIISLLLMIIPPLAAETRSMTCTYDLEGFDVKVTYPESASPNDRIDVDVTIRTARTLNFRVVIKYMLGERVFTRWETILDWTKIYAGREKTVSTSFDIPNDIKTGQIWIWVEVLYYGSEDYSSIKGKKYPNFVDCIPPGPYIISSEDAKLRDDYGKLKEDYVALGDELNVVKAELSDTARELEDMKKQLSDAHFQLNEVQGKLAAVNSELDKTRKELGDLNAKLAEAKDENEKLKADVRSLNSEKSALENELSVEKVKSSQLQFLNIILAIGIIACLALVAVAVVKMRRKPAPTYTPPTVQVARPPAVAPPPPPPTHTCPFCGAEIRPADVFCPNCGKKIKE